VIQIQKLMNKRNLIVKNKLDKHRNSILYKRLPDQPKSSMKKIPFLNIIENLEKDSEILDEF